MPIDNNYAGRLFYFEREEEEGGLQLSCHVVWICAGLETEKKRRRKNMERFTILRVILAQGPC